MEEGSSSAPILTLHREIIKTFVKKERLGNLYLYMLHRQGKTKVGDLDRQSLTLIRNILESRMVGTALERVIDLALPARIGNEWTRQEYIRGKWADVTTLSSKDWRGKIFPKLALTSLKCGIELTQNESRTYFRLLNKLTNVRHKSAMLRFIHGEFYSASRLHRFGLSETPLCEHCQEIETINHKLIECTPIRQLWETLVEISNDLDIVRNPEHNLVRNAIGATVVANSTLLTLNCELLTNVMRRNFERPPNYTDYIKRMIQNLIIKETSKKIKGDFIRLLNGD